VQCILDTSLVRTPLPLLPHSSLIIIIREGTLPLTLDCFLAVVLTWGCHLLFALRKMGSSEGLGRRSFLQEYYLPGILNFDPKTITVVEDGLIDGSGYDRRLYCG